MYRSNRSLETVRFRKSLVMEEIRGESFLAESRRLSAINLDLEEDEYQLEVKRLFSIKPFCDQDETYLQAIDELRKILITNPVDKEKHRNRAWRKEVGRLGNIKIDDGTSQQPKGNPKGQKQPENIKSIQLDPVIKPARIELKSKTVRSRFNQTKQAFKNWVQSLSNNNSNTKKTSRSRKRSLIANIFGR